MEQNKDQSGAIPVHEQGSFYEVAKLRGLTDFGITVSGKYWDDSLQALREEYDASLTREEDQSGAAVSGAPVAESKTDQLYGAVMNIPCIKTLSHFVVQSEFQAYKIGHRDARHAAAELIAAFSSSARAALKAQTAPTEAAQGDGALIGEGTRIAAQGEDSARLDASDLATIEEATKVLESAAKHNEGLGRTVFAHAQRDRAVRLRAILDRARASAETGGVKP